MVAAWVHTPLPLILACVCMIALSGSNDTDLAAIATVSVLVCAHLWIVFGVSWRILRRMDPWLSRLRSDAVEEEIHEKRVTEYDRRNDIGRLT